ncbi:MAG TPA: crossover junction endodeoxyribonuclease RuvC [Solirubrobacteraceae bacterium]|nr:crossover junction endodeoxyribonuclease RuvC [Solirubrobacteraceae bacterium]
MLVLGIDPGTASTGYGLVTARGSRLRAVEHGVIETRAGVALELRLAQIHARVAELLERHRPDVLAIEELYFGANVQTAFAVGQARGVVLLAAGQRGLPARSYTPQQVKSAVCGSGRAAKDQVGRMVARLLGLAAAPTPDHAADALAVAVAELNRAPLSALAAAVPRPTPARRSSPAPGGGPSDGGPPGGGSPAGRGVSAATLTRARAGGAAR